MEMQGGPVYVFTAVDPQLLRTDCVPTASPQMAIGDGNLKESRGDEVGTVVALGA